MRQIKLKTPNNSSLDSYCYNLIKDYITNHDISSLKSGKYLINDTDYVIKTNYQVQTKSEGFIESHLKYIDIHYIINGSERIYYNEFQDNEILKAYDNESDAFILQGKLENYLDLKSDDFAIFKPNDSHLTKVRCNDPSVSKLIFKVKI